MKIISFAINNFRGITGGFENNRINFSNSNTVFIFGQNNVGKSTFLNTRKPRTSVPFSSRVRG